MREGSVDFASVLASFFLLWRSCGSFFRFFDAFYLILHFLNDFCRFWIDFSRFWEGFGMDFGMIFQ